MKKIFVLDTNVLLHDPQAIFSFEDNEIIIPAVVLEEIDSKKRLADELAAMPVMFPDYSIKCVRMDDSMKGSSLPNGGLLKVELNHRSYVRVQDMFGEMSNDNRILAVALNYSMEEKEKPEERPVIIVSKDVLVRIKADVLGLSSSGLSIRSSR